MQQNANMSAIFVGGSVSASQSGVWGSAMWSLRILTVLVWGVSWYRNFVPHLETFMLVSGWPCDWRLSAAVQPQYHTVMQYAPSGSGVAAASS